MIPYYPQPVLHLGPLAIHSFGVLVACAVLVGTHILNKRSIEEGIDPQISSQLVVWVLVAGFIGAHLVDRLVYFPHRTLKDPLSLLKIWEGISSFGGFLGASVGAALYIHRAQLGRETWRYLDAVAYAFPFGWIFGRFGCFSAHDHPGLPTDFFLAVRFPEGPRHDLGLEEALYTIVLAGAIYLIGRKPRVPGVVTALVAILYAPVRFGLDFLRVVDVRYFGLTPGQYGAILLVLVGVVILVRARMGLNGELRPRGHEDPLPGRAS